MHYDYDDDVLSPKQRKEKKQKKIAVIKEELLAKGVDLNPIEIKARAKIAKSFWAKKWYENISTYEDLDHRLPLGRQLLSLGSIIDLKILPLKISAKVFAEDNLFSVNINFKKIPEEQQKKLTRLIQKEICSLAEFLTGKVSPQICDHITHKEHGLFPTLNAIKFNCDCTDYAEFCSHAAACLCAVVVRFDQDPGVFFKLRNIQAQDFFQTSNKKEKKEEDLTNHEISEVFGINLAD